MVTSKPPGPGLVPHGTGLVGLVLSEYCDGSSGDTGRSATTPDLNGITVSQ
jgi:hypothetical protein